MLDELTTMPESTISTDLEARFALYTGFGVFVCIANLITITVFSSSKEFLQRYIVFNALAVADLINGFSFVTAGIFRNLFMFQGHYFVPTTSTECLFHTPWGILMIVAGQLPALLNLFISLERVVALEFHAWYRRVWRDRHKYYLVATAFLITAGLFLLTVGLNFTHQTVSSTRICAVMNSTGIVFGTIHYTLIALTYLFCFIVLMTIFKKTNRSRKPSRDERRRQLMLQSITGVSVILVSIPNLVLILNEWKLPKFNDLLVGVIYCLYATHSSLTLVIYLIFRPDFRARLLYLCGLRKNSTVEVTIIQTTTANLKQEIK